jgi:Ser/Thr protein kinase RdoA (MazF antagonist)
VEIVVHVRDLVQRLERDWIPPARLPVQLIHGDPRLSDICATPDGMTVYFDFEFAAMRPQVRDLAYASVFMVLGMDGAQAPQSFAWDVVPRLISAYEGAVNTHLLPDESSALLPYAVAVLLYHPALDGFTADPVGLLRSRQPWIRLAEWILDNPAALAVR